MENFVHASVSHAALAEFGRNARAVGVQLHALEIFEKNECMVRWAVAPYSCGDKREMYSLSKSFTSTAAGVAFGMGKLHPDDGCWTGSPNMHPCVRATRVGAACAWGMYSP